MSSKLKSGPPRRQRRNKAIPNNMRTAAMPEARRTAGGLGSDAERPRAPKRRVAMGAPDAGSDIGRRVGQTTGNVKRAQARPEKTRRDRPVDTSKPGASASDRKVGAGHTARRNTKLNTRKATVMLEDSATGKPSRKSTRRSANRLKGGTQLTRRTKRAVRSPKARTAQRGA